MLERLYRFLSSLKLAVTVILGLVAALTAATFVESGFDTPTAQYYVYRSLWFKGILFALAINLAAVMVDRWPWKRRHGPFLLAHIGILLLLFGSWLTEKFGVDGSLRVSEGEVGRAVELSNHQLILAEDHQARAIQIPWIPPSVSFRKFNVRDRGLPYDIEIDQYLTHADPQVSFVPEEDTAHPVIPAAKLNLKGGPMRISQDLWLWGGDPQFSQVQAGPARLVLTRESELPKIPANPADVRGPLLELARLKDGTIHWRSTASDRTRKEGRIPPGKAKGSKIDVGWRGGVELTLLEWIPSASPLSQYKPSRMQYGPQAAPPALHLRSGMAETWLGLGDRAEFKMNGKLVSIAFFPQRLVLPFGVRLDRFQVLTQDGTRDPAAYISHVTVVDQTPGAAAESKSGNEPEARTISMNEPLKRAGYTLYQASYEDGEPRPVTSIFSVNQDPGRPWKYVGSLLLTLGSIWLFAVKYRKANVSGPSAPGPKEMNA